MRDTSNMDTLLACIQRTLMEVRVFLVESQIVNLQRDLEKAKGAEIEQQRMIVVQILDLLIKKTRN